MKLREMSLTCRPATASELHAWGTVAYLSGQFLAVDGGATAR